MANVTVDPDIFDSQGEACGELFDGWEGPSPFFLVVSDETDKAAEALHVAIGRCMRVDGKGNELTSAEVASTSEYTPNYYSPVYLTDRGPMEYLDTKGELPRAMAETMLRILAEEVEARGITAYLTTPPRGPSQQTAAPSGRTLRRESPGWLSKWPTLTRTGHEAHVAWLIQVMPPTVAAIMRKPQWFALLDSYKPSKSLKSEADCPALP